MLTESSHESNKVEVEEKLTSASTILDRLKAQKVSDFACKRKVAVNPAPCGKHTIDREILKLKYNSHLKFSRQNISLLDGSGT